MPYIAEDERVIYDAWLDVVDLPFVGDPGHLNYVLTRIVDHAIGPEYGYVALNAAVGVLESAKAELLRRVVAPYENLKASLNGDAYPWTLGDGT